LLVDSDLCCLSAVACNGTRVYIPQLQPQKVPAVRLTMVSVDAA
jgi:hypothetical protein